MYQKPLEIDRLCDKCQGLVECITPSYFKTKKFKCTKCGRITSYNARLSCLNCVNGILIQFAHSTIQHTSKYEEKEYYYMCDLCQVRKVHNSEI